ncbi:WecB/TagA/CpsF family glycosyltransferase [Candidatus Peregrinibacteria bacterium]|nr:WecB/TagA/CpsF family glycosyltransferase [Candidatus Peregrinibacteria bacterium]
MSEKVRILKVRFDKITMTEAIKKALEFAKDTKHHYICTPNPEILLAAEENPKYEEVLNKSDLNIADGIGILWASKFKKITEQNQGRLKIFGKWLTSLSAILFYPKYIRTEITERVTGADLMQNICKAAANEGLKIFLLGAGEGIAEKVKTILETKYPGIKIVGTHAGSPRPSMEAEITKKTNETDAQILFVAYGAPAQELWIARNLKKLTTVRLAIGIGGAFDYLAGVRKRAPKWLQKIGAEWLHRLIQQPSRIKRIFNATVKFPVKVLKKKLK